MLYMLNVQYKMKSLLINLKKMKNRIYFIFIWILLTCIVISCRITNHPDHHKFFNQIIGEWKLKDKPVIEKWNYTDNKYEATVWVTSDAENVITEVIKIVENENGIFYEERWSIFLHYNSPLSSEKGCLLRLPRSGLLDWNKYDSNGISLINR